SDDLEALLRSEIVDGPQLLYLRSEDNVGVAEGLARGISAALGCGTDYFWLLDDDSRPSPSALERVMTVATRSSTVGIVGLAGGFIRHGQIRHDREPEKLIRMGKPAVHCDFVLLDGAVVSRRAVEIAGVPRGDYFMMMQDVEYPLRIGRAGFEVVLVPDDGAL